MKFFTHDTLFSHSDCKSVDGQHSSAKLPNLQGTLSNPQSDIVATIQEQNVTAMFIVACWLANYLHMWQSRVEIEGYSVTYFDRIAAFKAPYR